MPAEPLPRGVLAHVEAVAGEGGQVDAAHEGHAVVDHDQLLVVAVHRPLPRVERHRDPRPADELVAHAAHLATVGMEERQRRTGPREHANVAPAGRVREQLAQRRASPAHAEAGAEEPAREVDVRARARDLGGHARQRLGAVDEQLEPVAARGSERAGLGPTGPV